MTTQETIGLTRKKMSEAVIAEIVRVERQNGDGTITAAEVVDAARDPNNPMHGEFEWNDALAGEAHRIEQAQGLIRRVKLVVHFEEVTLRIPAYVRDSRRDMKDAGYLRVSRVRGNTAAMVLATETAMLLGLARRVADLAKAKTSSLPLSACESLASAVELIASAHAEFLPTEAA